MANPFKEIYFPIGIAYGSQLGHEFKTYLSTNSNGQECRSGEWGSNALTVFDVAKGIQSDADLATLKAFHRIVQGRLYGFLFVDPTDCTLTDEPLDVSGGGPSYQIRKAYTYSDPFSGTDFTEYRTITRPINGPIGFRQSNLRFDAAALTVKVNGTPVTITNTSGGGGTVGFGFNEPLWNDSAAGSTVTVDYASGVITWVSGTPPGASDTLTVSGAFAVPVRFDNDRFMSRAAEYQLFDTSVTLREIRI